MSLRIASSATLTGSRLTASTLVIRVRFRSPAAWQWSRPGLWSELFAIVCITLFNQAYGNQFGIFVRHARHVLVTDNHVSGNCQGILVLDDGQAGGAGNATIVDNSVINNNKFCAKNEDTPVNTQGGGILLLGATQTLVTYNFVAGNKGKQINSGGIVVLSAHALSHGSNPNFDTIARNTAFRNQPADLRWDGTGIGVRFKANHCQTSVPAGLCH